MWGMSIWETGSEGGWKGESQYQRKPIGRFDELVVWKEAGVKGLCFLYFI